MTIETIKVLLRKLIESRENEIRELKQFLKTLQETPKEIIEHSEFEFLTKKNQLLARLLKREGSLTVLPVESLKIQSDDRAILWLRNKVLPKASEKHGIKFQLTEKEGVLTAIQLEGPNAELERLLEPISWSLEKAANRQ
ncbi:hypothetical protein DRO54_03480 [Candidatus Bathyarchaeota archaeon]|nr:MAG: hypothetical protein DRO54_03480 [Candidatus Bathyarchaeota archaeon]